MTATKEELAKIALDSVKAKLRWSVGSNGWSVSLTPDDCVILLKALGDPPTGTKDKRVMTIDAGLKMRSQQWDSEKPRAISGDPGDEQP